MTTNTRSARTRRIAADIPEAKSSTSLAMVACAGVGPVRSRGEVLPGAPGLVVPRARGGGRRRGLHGRRVAAPGRGRRRGARAGGRGRVREGRGELVERRRRAARGARGVDAGAGTHVPC